MLDLHLISREKKKKKKKKEERESVSATVLLTAINSVLVLLKKNLDTAKSKSDG